MGTKKVRVFGILWNDSRHKDTRFVGDAVFLSREELQDYLAEQARWQGVRVRKGEGKKKQWMALELREIQMYPSPIKPKRFVAVGGQYLRE